MATTLIQLEDDTLIEVEVPGSQIEEISGGLAERVNATFNQIQPILVKTCRPVVAAWRELNQELGQDTAIEQAEVQIGLSFEGEGNIYVTKSKAGANLTVKLILKAKNI